MWESLRNVLTAYAAHDPVMGYVQSMNFIAAFLLLAGLKEEDRSCASSRWSIASSPATSARAWRPPSWTRGCSPGCCTSTSPRSASISRLSPRITSSAAYPSQWLLTLFVNALPTDVTMRIWDRVFATGSRAPLFAACIALLTPRSNDVLGCNEMGECIELLQGLGGDLGDADADAFLAVVDAHLANELSPTLVLLETARERGRHRRPSDAGLPDSVLAMAP